MPTLRQLQYLVAIAETRHFARAAELCHVTQPTLSTQLATLEKRLGLALVERAQHGAHLTPAGRLILERAESALRSVEEIRDIASAGKQGVVGTIRVGVLPTLGPYLLPELLPDIHDAYPQLKLYVREELSEDLVANLHRGKHDAVFTSLPIGSTDLQIHPLFWEPIMVAIPSGHRLAGRRTLVPGDLKGEVVLTLEPGHVLHRQIRDICEKYGAELQLDYEGTSLDTLRIMVGMGMGIALFPALYVRSEIPKDANVKVAKLPDAETGRTIVLVTRSSSPRARDYDAFSKSLRQFIRSKFADVVRLVS